MSINLSDGREYIFRAAGQFLYEENVEIGYVYFLVDGTIDVFRGDDQLTRLYASIETDAESKNSGKTNQLIILNEFEAILGQKTSVSVKTASDCVFMVIDSTGLEQAIIGNPEIAIRFVVQLAKRADGMRNEINELRTENNRLRRLLFENRSTDEIERVLEQTSPGTLLLDIGHFLKLKSKKDGKQPS